MRRFLVSACLASLIAAGGVLLAFAGAMNAPSPDPYAAERKAMLDEIARITRQTAGETGRAALSERVMAAIGRVARHRLVASGDETRAYLDRPLPIGLGQTI